MKVEVLMSEDGKTYTDIRKFTNDAETTLYLYTLGPDGARLPYGELAQGESMTEPDPRKTILGSLAK